jgi:hypothetical protein
MPSRLVVCNTMPTPVTLHDPACPYSPSSTVFCAASVMTVAINDRTRDNYCSTEDYDSCPLFLAKVLRSRG